MSGGITDAPAGADAPAEAPSPGRSRGLFVRTWGCQMNVYDSRRIADVLAPHGWRSVSSAEEADLVILNTCHIREKASEKLFSELGRLRPLKRRRGGGPLLGVAGCVAQAEGAELFARAPFVDLVFGPQTVHRLPALVARAEAGERALDTEFPPEAKFDHLPAAAAPVGASAFLTIQEGCDKFCSFCVVPYTRGAEYSRPARQVVEEARQLLAAGAREIVLLGQNVNGWRGEALMGGSWGLGRLVLALAELDGLERLRYTTSHPLDMDDALIEAHRTVPQLMPFLHLPVQSGSDRMLKAMNRRHDRAAYLALVDRLRAARPDLALSSDFIVGHPGETEADFADTLALVRAVGFAQAYSFRYSRRPGTPAAAAADPVPEAVARERLQRLQAVLTAGAADFNRRALGRPVEMLVERRGERPGQLAGRSPWQQAVHAEGPERLIGRLVTVAVSATSASALGGRIVAVEGVALDGPAAGHSGEAA